MSLSAVVAMMGTAGSAAPSGASEEPQPSDTGWISTDHGDAPLMNATRQSVSGERVDGECRLQESLELSPGDPPIERRVEAFNPDTCEFVVEVGNPGPLDDLPEVPDGAPLEANGLSGLGSAAGAAGVGDVALPGGSTTAAAFRQAKAYGRQLYHDPPHIQLNNQYNEITWEFDGNCVGTYSTFSNTEADSEFTGWGWDWHYFWSGDNGAKGVCPTYAFSSGRSHHFNHAFCFPQAMWNPTEVHYDPNEMRGHRSGGTSFHPTSWVHGACGSWLHPHSQSAYIK